MLERYTVTGDPLDLAGDLSGLAASQRPVAVTVPTMSSGGGRDVDGPLAIERGLSLDSVWLTSTGPIASLVFTFQPYCILKGTVRYLCPSVSLAGLVVARGVPFRCHKAERLRFAVPLGGVLGLTVVRASGTLTNPTFHFILGGG